MENNAGVEKQVLEFVSRAHPTDFEVVAKFPDSYERVFKILNESGLYRKVENHWFRADEGIDPKKFLEVFHPTDEMIAKYFKDPRSVTTMGFRIGDRWFPTRTAVKIIRTELSSPAPVYSVLKMYGENAHRFLTGILVSIKDGMYVSEINERDARDTAKSPFFRMIPLGGGNSIGDSCYYVRVGEHYVILDAGAQETAGVVKKPRLDILDDLPPVEAIFISHAHADHIGALEDLAKKVRAPIYMTPETLEIYRIEREKLKNPIPGWLADRIRTERTGSVNGLHFELLNAGHIDGSAMIYLSADGDSVLYTGDFNVEHTEFQEPAEPAKKPVGSLIIEATYGDTPAREEREERVNRLIEMLASYTEQGKFVFLPVFAKGRFDEVVSIVDKAIGEGRINANALALGMGTEISFTMGHRFEHVRLVTSEDVKEIGGDITQRIKMLMDRPLIVIASSGFMDNGVSEQLISEAIKRPNVVVIKTGYAPPFSMAGKLTKKGDRISIIPGEEVTIECDVENISLSAHATMDDILDFILRQSPHDVIFVHREAKLKELKQKLKEHEIFSTAPVNLAMTFTYGHYTDKVWDHKEEAGDTEMYQCECGAKFPNWSAAMMHMNATGHRIIDRTSVFVFKNPKTTSLPDRYSERVREATKIENRLYVRADFTDEEAREIAEEIEAESVEKQVLVNNARMNFPAFVAHATEKVSKFLGVDLVTPHTVKRDLPFGISGFYSPKTRTIAIPANRFRSDEDALLVITHETVHYAQHMLNPKAFNRIDENAKEFIEGFAQYATEKMFGNLSRFLELYHEIGVPEYYSEGRVKFFEIEKAYGEEKAKEIALHGTPEEFQKVWEDAHAKLMSERTAEDGSEKLARTVSDAIRKALADPDEITSFVVANFKKYYDEVEDNREEAIAMALSDYFLHKLTSPRTENARD